MYKVPKHLDPRIEDDWNYRVNGMDGEVHVSYAEGALGHDIIFEGNPTPGMLPLDAEATEISSKFDWTPTQGVDEESQRASFYAKLGDKLVNHLTDMKADAAAAPQAHGFDKFLEAIAALMAQNQELMAKLAGKVAPQEDELEKQAKALGEMKPRFEEEPLEDVAPTEAELNEAIAAAQAKEAQNQAHAKGVMRRGRI
jgi:hypothetical protein